MTKKFELGQVVSTSSIAHLMQESRDFATQINKVFHRYQQGDWGELDASDKKLNDDAVESGNDRILAKYETIRGDIYIITEWDRSATTILFTSEY